MDGSRLTEEQRTLIQEALTLVTGVQQEVGAHQSLQTYLNLREAARKLELVLGAGEVEPSL